MKSIHCESNILSPRVTYLHMTCFNSRSITVYKMDQSAFSLYCMPMLWEGRFLTFFCRWANFPSASCLVRRWQNSISCWQCSISCVCALSSAARCLLLLLPLLQVKQWTSGLNTDYKITSLLASLQVMFKYFAESSTSWHCRMKNTAMCPDNNEWKSTIITLTMIAPKETGYD